jgi:hypothetical protein
MINLYIKSITALSQHKTNTLSRFDETITLTISIKANTTLRQSKASTIIMGTFTSEQLLVIHSTFSEGEKHLQYRHKARAFRIQETTVENITLSTKGSQDLIILSETTNNQIKEQINEEERVISNNPFKTALILVDRQVEVKPNKENIITIILGKLSFHFKVLRFNLLSTITSLNKIRPRGMKVEEFVKTFTISSTNKRIFKTHPHSNNDSKLLN